MTPATLAKMSRLLAAYDQKSAELDDMVRVLFDAAPERFLDLAQDASVRLRAFADKDETVHAMLVVMLGLVELRRRIAQRALSEEK